MFARAVLFGAAAAVALSPKAQAGFFSFASDHADQAWTFRGNGGSFNTQSLGINDFISLNLDDNNGVLPRLTFSTRFAANITMAFAGDVSLGGGSVSHNYAASGNFTFTDVATNQMLLTVTFADALLTARGTAGTWGTTASVQDDNTAGSISMIWTGANLPGYGLTPGGVSLRQFGFDLDAINTSGAIPYAGQNPGVGLTSSLPNANWFAESSFVAVIPGPGALSLLALAGLAARRRR
jgi:hypothetical protein